VRLIKLKDKDSIAAVIQVGKSEDKLDENIDDTQIADTETETINE
jgi:hypothetical protein